MTDTFRKPPDHDERMKAAERVASWELGNAAWAQVILGAYMYPEGTHEALDREGAPR